MSSASAETRAQYVTRLRILYRPGRSPRTQRNPGDQDRAEPLSEPTSLGQLYRNEAKIAAAIAFAHKRQPREQRTQTPSNRITPCGELMPPVSSTAPVPRCPPWSAYPPIATVIADVAVLASYQKQNSGLSPGLPRRSRRRWSW